SLNKAAEYFNIPVDKFSGILCFLLGHTKNTLPKLAKLFTPENSYTSIVTTEEVYSLWEQTNLLEDNSLVDLAFPFKKSDFEPFSVTAKVNSFSDTNQYFSIKRLVSFDWKVSIGNNALTQKELDSLVQSKIPLIQVNGEWKMLNRQSLQPIIRKINKYKKKTSLQDLLLESMRQEDSSIQVSIDLSEQFDKLKSILSGSIDRESMSFPGALEDILRHYQKDGIAWLWKLKQVSFHPILADDMGLGKTLQILVFLLKEKIEKKPKNPSLVICPTAVLENWKQESIRFTDSLSLHIHHGIDRLHNKEFIKNAKNYDLILTSYNLALRDVKELQKIKWNNVILDEAQNIKNPHAKKSTAIKTIPSEFRIAMTGTPVENHVGDLWSIFDFLQPGWLGSEKQFQTSFLRPIQKKRDPNKTKTLQKMTQPFILRRLKTDSSIIPDLPDKIESKEYCLLTKEQVSLYEACLKSSLGEIENAEGIARKGKVLTLLLHLKQICNHPAHYLKEYSSKSSRVDDLNISIDHRRSGKLKRLWTLLEEIFELNEKVLLFTQYKEMGSLLKKMLSESFSDELCFYHGGLTRKKRDEMICNFQENDNVRLMILSLKAGGIGLNLTAANHVFHIDRWWNPAVENQATDRAFRIGQKKNVHVHKMICTGTMEETIDQLIETKSSIADEIMGSKTSLLTEMSTTQLKSLFELRKDILSG
ncbi:MAG: DEAD/DEAH box helicase, partial [Caldisericia bacterium]|nr:DEAD/DEAH box helicase [Caldisericia bacterium]